MLNVIMTLLRSLLSAFRGRKNLVAENLALRHQLMVIRRQVKRPRLTNADRSLWVILRRFWPDWDKALVLVKPATVISWHREGFRLYWKWKSLPKGGRPCIDRETRELIRRLWLENPTWGSPHIMAELAKLGIHVSDSTVRKYKPRFRKPPSQTWKTFLKNHVDDIVAIDFFVVPTITFRLLYVFIVMSRDRRRILHFNVSESPSARWTGQQVIETFPYETAPKYLLRDRDGIYSANFVRRVRSMNIKQVVTARKSPWQNAYIERMGSIRRECLDHIIVINEAHLRRILREYFMYYHKSRTHMGLNNDCPIPRAVQPPELGQVFATPVLVGLHHEYRRRAA
jgi:transposase InsO family protein